MKTSPHGVVVYEISVYHRVCDPVSVFAPGDFLPCLEKPGRTHLIHRISPSRQAATARGVPTCPSMWEFRSRALLPLYLRGVPTQTARLQRFSLTSSISGASDSLSDILDPTNISWQLAANLTALLYDGGRQKIDVEIATIEQEQAIENHVQTAIVAFPEVGKTWIRGVSWQIVKKR